MIKFKLSLVVLTAFVLLTGCKGEADKKEEKTLKEIVTKKPNIIVILSDDAGYADIETYGNKEIPTPNINSLAEEGTLFTSGYVSASVCAPSRAGLMTGRYQQRFGFENNMSGEPAEGYTREDMGLDEEEQTIADRLKEEGYSTLAVGKWHLGLEDKHFPLNRGFDQFYGFKEGLRNFFPYKKERDEKFALYDNNKIVPENEITYLTDMFTDRTIDFIKENKEKDKPFFIYLAYNCVHTPLQAKDENLAKFDSIDSKGRQTYDAMLHNMDEGIGKIVETLKENNLTDNTLIVFLNDNGGATTNYSDNGQLRGMKGSVWEGGIRVAFIMKWPGHIPEGEVYNNPVSSLDIMATCLAAAGNNNKSKLPLDGVDLIPYIDGQKTGLPHKDLFWKRGYGAAIRSGDWKLIRVKTNPILLFNLSNDISEQVNLAKRYPEKVAELSKKLDAWETTLPPSRWSSSYGPENTIIKHRMETVGRDMERKYP